MLCLGNNSDRLTRIVFKNLRSSRHSRWGFWSLVNGNWGSSGVGDDLVLAQLVHELEALKLFDQP